MPRSLKKGPFVDDHLMKKVDDMNKRGDEAGDQDLVAPLDDRARDGRPHDRRARRPQARPGVHHASRWSATSSASSRPTRTFRSHGAPDERRIVGEVTEVMAAKATRQVHPTRRRARCGASVDMIRGQHVAEARRILRFYRRSARRATSRSCWTRRSRTPSRTPASIRGEPDGVREAWVDEGPTLKRFRPRAYGRATKVRKRTSHVTLVVRDDGRGTLVGHKVNPYGFRLGVIYPWKSQLVRRARLRDQLHEDVRIRKHIRWRLSRARHLQRSTSSARATRSRSFIRTARPGIVIGRKGAGGRPPAQGHRALHEEARRREGRGHEPGRAASRARDRRRAAGAGRRRAARRAASRSAARCAAPCRPRCARAPRACRSQCRRTSGRHRDVAPRVVPRGRVPLHTLRAKVDYGTAEAKTTFGEHRREGLDLPRRRDPRPRAGDRRALARAAAHRPARPQRSPRADQPWRDRRRRARLPAAESQRASRSRRRLAPSDATASRAPSGSGAPTPSRGGR